MNTISFAAGYSIRYAFLERIGAMRKLLLILPILGILPGCGTFVTEQYFELKSDGAKVEKNVPSRCGGPGSDVLFDLPNKNRVSLRGWTGHLFIEVSLAPGNKFQFTSKDIKTLTGWPSGTPLPTIGILSFKYQPTDLLSADRSWGETFSAPIKIGGPSDYAELYPTENFRSFTFKLPDAKINGELVTFPPVEVKYKEISYYKSSCLR